MELAEKNRLNVGIFGLKNAGKSSLFNYLLNQDTSRVSPKAGTTVDPVEESMEVKDLGPIQLIDTAGLDACGEQEKDKTKESLTTMGKCDLAIYLRSGDDKKLLDQTFIKKLRGKEIPLIDLDPNSFAPDWQEGEELKARIFDQIKKFTNRQVKAPAGDLVEDRSLIILALPKGGEAPKSRLVLPQVQMIRELVNERAMFTCVDSKNLSSSLKLLGTRPDLVIADSRVFEEVEEVLPDDINLVSLSVLFAGLKGDIKYFSQSAEAIDRLSPQSKVLICEGCPNAPMDEDIGIIRIPKMLKEKYGDMTIDFNKGGDFPDDIEKYDLIIHCGACMLSRIKLMSRVRLARAKGVPMTNYGVCLAKLNGILKKSTITC